MADYIAAVDAGNGGTNAVIATDKGYQQLYEPSVRASATGDSLGLGKQWELDYGYVDCNGHRYVTGDDVVRVTRRNLERHMGANRYGNEFHQFLVAVSLAKLGVERGSVDLTLFAPPGMYKELKPFLEKRFLEGKGKVAIQLKGDKEPRKWRYEQITVWPEGIGAAACFVVDDTGTFVPSDVLTGETIILDIGAYTLDALKLVDGSFNPETLEHATWEQAGVHVHIREPMLRAVKDLGEDFKYVSVDDIDRVIRLGAASGDYTLSVTEDVDLKPLYDRCRERFAEWIANNIVDGVYGGFRGIRQVILVGGGTVMVEDHLKKWFPDKILSRKKHKLTRDLHPVDMNAVGGLRLALLRLHEKQVG
jgi:hypothetical protein